MRRPALTLATGLLPMLVACALIRAERRALGNASRWLHGVDSAPDSVRANMAANRWATDMIEDALLGRRRAPEWFDTATALYWLSDGGRPKYLRTLRRFARHPDGDVASFAIYGLVRHSGDRAVRARLLEVDANAPRDVRSNMAGLLALVNDSSARSLMRVINREDLRPQAIEWMEWALSAPPRPATKGPWPCIPPPEPYATKCPR